MIQSEQDREFIDVMRRCNGNTDIQKECEKSNLFMKSTKRSKGLIDKVLSNLSLKEDRFEILHPATENDIDELIKSALMLDESL